MVKKTQCLFIILFLQAFSNAWAVNHSPARLFGYQEIKKQDLSLFPQWLSVLERHLLNIEDSGSCQSATFNRCHLREWQTFLSSIKNKPVSEQIKSVNRYANAKEYTLDIENYGLVDYWATPKEFLMNNGDCEDYAITKLFSLRWLGYPMDDLRIVVLQDTNLRIPHAVLAVADNNDIMIMDNQIHEVISHRDIVHYAPVYSINEQDWWIHLPN